MRRRDHVKKEENVSYWQSYSDMMAALLLIFVLVIAVAIVALNDYKEKLAEQNEELLARQDLLEKQADEYLKLKEVQNVRELSKNEMKSIKGGGMSATAWAVIAGVISFISGIFDGFTRPYKCR